MKKTVGIIGGLGPETTSEFYLELVFGCQKLNKNHRPGIVIASVPMPLDIEKEAIEKNKGIERFIPYLETEAKRLEQAGVDFIVMPCNSLHVFIDDIRKSVKIPVLSIVEETVKYIKDNKFKKIGIISTSATIENRVYENEFVKQNISYVVPNELQRAEMNKIIHRLVTGIHLNQDREKILSVITDMKAQGVDAIALACTDLQLLLPIDKELTIFDTMKILADATIEDLD